MATPSDTYRGNTYPATKEGFAQLMQDANTVAAQFRLVTVVRLDKALAAVYERRSPKVGDSFFD